MTQEAWKTTETWGFELSGNKFQIEIFLDFWDIYLITFNCFLEYMTLFLFYKCLK